MNLAIISRTKNDTDHVANLLAPMLGSGDAILLKGDLASGKTTFVQALVLALGSDAEVTSPTFMLAHFYPIENGVFLHLDAYRLSGVAEFRNLGLEEYIVDSITTIEWGNIVEGLVPDSLSIAFEFVDDGETFRKLTFSSLGREVGTRNEDRLQLQLNEYWPK